MSEGDAGAEAAVVFAALGHRTRLAIISRLAATPQAPIAALAEPSGLTRQAVSKHLAVLEAAGLVVSRRVGRERRFGLQSQAVDEADAFLQHVSARWDVAIGRLRRHLEAPSEEEPS